jgi:DNA-binding NarL/FixJ family response regulator
VAIRILIADRQDMFREVLRILLASQEDFAVVGDTDDAEELARLAVKHRPNVILLDLKLRNHSAIEALKLIAALKTDARPIILTDTIERSEIIDGLLCGARGVIRKEEPSQMLFKSIRAVAEGQYWVSRNGVIDLVKNLQSLTLKVAGNARKQTDSLSIHQQLIIQLILDGYSNKEIAQELSISERTVKYHLKRIFRKFGVSGRMELVQQTLKNRYANTSIH